MAPRMLAILALVLLCASGALAQKCAGPAAKYRSQWMYKVVPNTDMKALNAAVEKWMAECPSALRHGNGPALSTKPQTFGLTQVPANSEIADYAGWADWKSLDDLKKCYATGLKSGTVAAIRKFSAKATRLVIDLAAENRGNPMAMCTSETSYAPATVRYMFTYVLKSPSVDTCKKALSYQNAIQDATGIYIRAGESCDAVMKDDEIYAPGVMNTADYGGYTDFKSLDDLTKYLSNKDLKAAAARAPLRDMAASIMRVAIALPEVAKPMGRKMV